MTIISPSLLAADFAFLKDELDVVKASGAEAIHLDVMDGIFVPNLSFGLSVIESIRKVSDLMFDVHLMIKEPLSYIEQFAKAGSDMITFHLESDSDVQATIDAIKAQGKKVGISIKPATPVEALVPYLDQLDLVLVMSVEPGFGGQSFMPECLPKIAAIRALAPDVLISVDGGINGETSKLVKQAGANMLVAGSYFFKAEDKAAAVEAMKA